MRILHIIGSADPRSGGPIEGILRQNEATSAVGSRELMSLDLPDAPFLADLPIAVHALGETYDGWLGKLAIRYRYSRRMIPWLRENMAKYDVVVVNGLWNYSSFGASRVLPGAATPYFVFTHGMMDPWFRRTYPIKTLFKQIAWWIADGRLMAGARSVLFTTEEERTLARGQFAGHAYRETVVGYGTMPPPPKAAAQIAAFQRLVPSLEGRPYLLFISRIHPKKGIDLLIEAVARQSGHLGDLQFVVAGPDEDGCARELRKLAEDRGVADRFHWAGMVSGDAKWGAFYNADAFILPSHQENFGIVVAEAMGCGVPVLITNKINIWREIDQDGAGLVEDDTIAGIEALLTRWMGLPLDGRKRMGQAARRSFLKNFDIRTVAVKLMETLRQA